MPQAVRQRYTRTLAGRWIMRATLLKGAAAQHNKKLGRVPRLVTADAGD